MSYEDTHCPCGGFKWCDTFLCLECERHVAGRKEVAIMADPKEPLDNRRHAAIILVTLSRQRGREAARREQDLTNRLNPSPYAPQTTSPHSSPAQAARG